MKNLEPIQTFIAVAEQGSFAGASRLLDLSTSAVSARIQALEARLGVRLLNRSTRAVRLTDEGEIYLTRCRDLLAQLQDLEDSLSQPDQLQGRVRISIPLDLPMEPFARAISAFSKLHPLLTIDVHCSDEAVDLITHDADIAIRGRAPGSQSLVARKLGEGVLHLFAAKSGQQAFRLPLTDDQTDQKNRSEMILFDPLNMSAQLPPGMPWKASPLRTQHLALAKQWCLDGQGLALLPYQFCAKEVTEGRLQIIETEEALPRLPLYIVYPNRKQLPRRLRALIDFLLEHQQGYPLI